MATVTAKPSRFQSANRFAPAMGWKAWAVHHAWVVPVVMLAAWLRFTGLGSHFLYGDEAEYSIVARYLSRDWTYLAYPAIESLGATPFVSQPPLLIYLMALSMRLFGTSELAAALPSLLLGTGTVLVVYALGHRLGGRFMGLSAAVLLAVLPFHIELTRKAMLDAGYTFFLVLTAYFLVAWLQTHSRKHALGVGIATACAALSKLPGMLAGPIVLLVFGYGVALTLWRRDWPAAREMGIQAGIGAAPIAMGALLYVGLLTYLQATQNLWMKLMWQFGRVSGGGAATELGAIARPASFYFQDPKFSFAVLFGSTIVTLALAGIVVAAYRFARHPKAEAGHLVPLAFTTVLLAFFLYSQRKEGFYLLPFAPFTALYIAYLADGLRGMLSWAATRVSSVRPRAALIATVLAALLVAVPAYGATTQAYGKFALGQTQEKYFGSGTKDAALWIHTQDPNAAQYGTLLGRFTLHYYNEQTTYHWYVDHTLIEQKVREGKLKYVVYDEYLGIGFDTDYMKELINRYHGTQVAEFRQGWGDVKIFELHA